MKEIIKLFILSAAVIVFFSGCKKYENFNTVIEVVIPPDYTGDYYFYWYHLCGFGGGFCNEMPGGSFDADKEQIYKLEINWAEVDEDINLRKKIKFSVGKVEPLMHLSIYKEVDSIISKIKPGRVYRWDIAAGTFEGTGEKTEKKCKILEDTWTLHSVNGDEVPCTYYYYDEKNKVIVKSGTYTFNSDGTWEGKLFNKMIVNGSSSNSTPISHGTYNCNGGSYSFTNDKNGSTGTGTVSSDRMTMSSSSGTEYVFIK